MPAIARPYLIPSLLAGLLAFTLDRVHKFVQVSGACVGVGPEFCLDRPGFYPPASPTGWMGGEIQPQIFAQVVSGLVDGRLDVATALAAPRWAADMPDHHAPPELTDIESRYHPEVIEDLARRGHRVVLRPPFDSGMGHAHAIELLDEGGFAAATDPRSEGLPAVW